MRSGRGRGACAGSVSAVAWVVEGFSTNVTCTVHIAWICAISITLPVRRPVAIQSAIYKTIILSYAFVPTDFIADSCTTSTIPPPRLLVIVTKPKDSDYILIRCIGGDVGNYPIQSAQSDYNAFSGGLVASIFAHISRRNRICRGRGSRLC